MTFSFSAVAPKLETDFPFSITITPSDTEWEQPDQNEATCCPRGQGNLTDSWPPDAAESNSELGRELVFPLFFFQSRLFITPNQQCCCNGRVKPRFNDGMHWYSLSASSTPECLTVGCTSSLSRVSAHHSSLCGFPKADPMLFLLTSGEYSG